MTELNLILLGPPGAGKGTQAERLEEDFHLPYIATGNMLRAAVEEGSELGKKAQSYMDDGKLVPDELIIDLILECVQEDQCNDGFLLDGFPRNLEQARSLDAAIEKLDRRLSAALLIDVPDEVIIDRITGRRVCSKEGHVYHVESNPPKHDGVCDIDGSKLIQRKDDTAEVVEKRLAVYHEQTAPIVDHYDEKGILKRFDGTRPPTEVHDHLRATIATLRLEDEI
jgi:adenylate kinase